MPQVMTFNAIVTCPHGGVGTNIPSSPIVTVGGHAVLVEGDTGTLSCAFITPCVGYVLRSMGFNSTFINGRRVILVTDFQQSATGFPLQVSDSNALFDESTPAPLPPGQTAPQLPPELLDQTPPVVAAAPTSLVFSKSVPPPVPLVTAFTASAAFPGQWMLLSQFNTEDPVDITGGTTNFVVVASEDPWQSQTLTVTLTPNPLFLSARNPGDTWTFTFTAVSKRGIHASVEVGLTVTA